MVRGGNGKVARGGWVWVLTGGFFGLSLLCASLPPGILWPAEGNGYDVLEYHLGALRDLQDAGRITYLPHNIYSNFPFGVEMLYLLGMILRGDPLRAAFTAQLLHAILGFLAAAATWCAARAVLCNAGPSRKSEAHIAGIAVATCPFVLYVGALAYVENGLLLYTALALAAIFEAGRVGQPRPGRWSALAGVMAGFVFGCKYIAAVQVVIPLGLAVAWVVRRKREQLMKSVVAYGLGAAVTMSPWLIRNVLNTGNPVFPLARSVFPEKAGVWNDDGAARWTEGHLPGPKHRSAGGRLERLWDQVFWNPLYGPIMLVGAAAAVIVLMRIRRFETLVPCVILFVCTLGTWIGFTHLVDRFAMVVLVPAAILVAVVCGSVAYPLARFGIASIIIVVNAGLILHLVLSTSTNKLLTVRDSVGIAWFTEGEWPTHQHVPKLNEIVRAGGKVLMVADARRFYLDRGVDYCVVFNRNPFAEAAERMPAKELMAWLRERGYSHLFVNWSEMARLRGSRYGFWKPVDVELFRRMNEAGLQVVDNYSFDEGKSYYGALFTVGP